MSEYRASVHEATGYTPNYLVFGHENRMPIDIVLNCPAAEEKYYTSTDEYVEAYQQRMRNVYEQVRQNLGQAAVRRKDYYDRKVKVSEFTPGSWVWYLYPRRRVGKSPKWQRYYTGPYLLTRVIPPNDVVLQKTKKSKSFVVHRDKIKLCHGPTPVSWLKKITKPQVVLQPESTQILGLPHVETGAVLPHVEIGQADLSEQREQMMSDEQSLTSCLDRSLRRFRSCPTLKLDRLVSPGKES